MKTNKITISQEVTKNIKTLNYYEPENFINDVKSYIKAIKERRMLWVIKSGSASGMSRTLKFNACEGSKGNFNYRQYSCLFIALGYKESKSNNCAFIVNGCGMDMVFNTNYNNIHDFKRMGFITDTECRELAQMTPTVL